MNSVSTATNLAPFCRTQKRASASESVMTVIGYAIYRKHGDGNHPCLPRATVRSRFQVLSRSGPLGLQSTGLVPLRRPRAHCSALLRPQRAFPEALRQAPLLLRRSLLLIPEKYKQEAG